MGKITKDDNGYHVRLSLTDSLTGRRVQKRVSARTKRLLDAEIARIRAEWNSGSWIEPDKTTVSQWCETWHSTYKASPSSRHRRGRDIRIHIAGDDIGRMPITRLRYAHVQDWVDRLVMRGLAPKTVRTIESSLSMALSHAVKRQLIPTNPCNGVDLPRMGTRRWCVLEADDARRVIADTRDDLLHVCWVLGVTLGLRRGELLALTWDDVDLSAGILRVDRTMTIDDDGHTRVGEDAKSAAGRRPIQLPVVCVTALRYHRARQNERRLAAGPGWIDSNVVIDQGLGQRCNETFFNRSWRKVKSDLSLPRDMRPHDLRHTAATLMLHAGIQVTTVSQILGHANPAITMRVYSHVLREMEDQAVERIDALFREQSAASVPTSR